MTHWHPMDRAPRDGTWLLLWVEHPETGGFMVPARWSAVLDSWSGPCVPLGGLDEMLIGGWRKAPAAPKARTPGVAA
jgi:hypothetical protein